MFALRSKVATVATRGFATEAAAKKYKVVVVGAGPGGLSVSSTISKLLGQSQVALVDPSPVHYYQPLFTYIGGGLKSLADARKPMAELVPSEADWVQKAVTKVNPETNTVTLSDGSSLGYDYLVVAAGIQLQWEKVKGLKEAIGKDSVASNYSPETVSKTYEFLQNFKGGNALFTFPNTPIKCPGAPTKIVFLAEEILRLNGVRSKSNVIYNTSLGKIFGIDHYGKVLQKIADERGIQVNFQTELIEINGANKEAVFRNNATKEVKSINYDFIHVAPPQGPPAFIKESGIADAGGFVDVDKDTLRHKKYANIYALGDCSNLPTSKTAAAITGESGVLKHNLIADLEGKKVEQAVYDGYTSCPLIIGKDELILAEFSGYTGKPLETFPYDQRIPNWPAQWLNKEIIPQIYWTQLLAGGWTGPGKIRKALAPFKTEHA